jgi:hypothetical protein
MQKHIVVLGVASVGLTQDCAKQNSIDAFVALARFLGGTGIPIRFLE